MAMSKAIGTIDRILSSKRRVKSNPPRQLPAYGPNESSMPEQDCNVEFEAIMGGLGDRETAAAKLSS